MQAAPASSKKGEDLYSPGEGRRGSFVRPASAVDTLFQTRLASISVAKKTSLLLFY